MAFPVSLLLQHGVSHSTYKGTSSAKVNALNIKRLINIDLVLSELTYNIMLGEKSKQGMSATFLVTKQIGLTKIFSKCVCYLRAIRNLNYYTSYLDTKGRQLMSSVVFSKVTWNLKNS